MDELVKMLDKNLSYLSHEYDDDVFYIFVASNRKGVTCPFCGHKSTRAHSTYHKSFQDLPIQEKKVIIILANRKMFCDNLECNHTTFAERFDFIDDKSKKTKRLEDEILDISLNCSTVKASQILRENVVDIGRSTISNLLKKKGISQSTKKK